MHTPRKRFGQNFLRDKHVIQRIISAIAPQANQHLVEIGSGEGALTFPLLAHCQLLDVVELDRDLVAWLQTHQQRHPNLQIHNADALKFDFHSLRGEHKLRLVGNLPYNISTPLLFHFIEYTADLIDMTLMLQKEVVDRMAAEPDSADYGRLSVMLQYHCYVEKLFDVSPESFFPPPKVNSSMVRLMPHASLPYPALNAAHFSKVVAQAFAQRRKTLRNTLKSLMSVELIEQANIDPQCRSETLGVEQFVNLSNIYTLNFE
jgi:16S rRNA (adenine1518-N6/adenine1519-N6)-dimethyltransferase